MILTVNILLEECERQKSKGNGNKKVYISSDEEGNSFHPLYFGFTDEIEDIKECQQYSDGIDGDLEELVILG